MKLLFEKETTVEKRYSTEKSKYYYYEQPPQKRTIKLFGEMRYLQFPYIQFVVRELERIYPNPLDNVGIRSDLYITASRLPCLNPETKIKALPLPNIDAGKICLGNDAVDKSGIELINHFWHSEFTYDYVSYLFRLKLTRRVMGDIDIDWEGKVKLFHNRWEKEGVYSLVGDNLPEFLFPDWYKDKNKQDYDYILVGKEPLPKQPSKEKLNKYARPYKPYFKKRRLRNVQKTK